PGRQLLIEQDDGLMPRTLAHVGRELARVDEIGSPRETGKRQTGAVTLRKAIIGVRRARPEERNRGNDDVPRDARCGEAAVLGPHAAVDGATGDTVVVAAELRQIRRQTRARTRPHLVAPIVVIAGDEIARAKPAEVAPGTA